MLLAVATELGGLAGARLVSGLVQRRGKSAGRGSVTPLDRLLFVFLVLVLGATALASLAPVTDGDALCYHLQVPKVFLIRQAVYFDPDLHETVYPLVTELLYAIALEFRGPVACRCLHWVLGLVFAANVAALARPSLGRRAWWAATLAVLVPAISNGMAAPLNDVSLAAFGAAAIFAWIRAIDRKSLASTIAGGGFFRACHGGEVPGPRARGSPRSGHSSPTHARSHPAIVARGWHARSAWRRLSWPRRSSWVAAGIFVPTFRPAIRSSPSSRATFGGAGLAEVLAPHQASAGHGALGAALGDRPPDSRTAAV